MWRRVSWWIGIKISGGGTAVQWILTIFRKVRTHLGNRTASHFGMTQSWCLGANEQHNFVILYATVLGCSKTLIELGRQKVMGHKAKFTNV